MAIPTNSTLKLSLPDAPSPLDRSSLITCYSDVSAQSELKRLSDESLTNEDGQISRRITQDTVLEHDGSAHIFEQSKRRRSNANLGEIVPLTPKIGAKIEVLPESSGGSNIYVNDKRKCSQTSTLSSAASFSIDKGTDDIPLKAARILGQDLENIKRQQGGLPTSIANSQNFFAKPLVGRTEPSAKYPCIEDERSISNPMMRSKYDISPARPDPFHAAMPSPIVDDTPRTGLHPRFNSIVSRISSSSLHLAAEHTAESLQKSDLQSPRPSKLFLPLPLGSHNEVSNDTKTNVSKARRSIDSDAIPTHSMETMVDLSQPTGDLFQHSPSLRTALSSHPISGDAIASITLRRSRTGPSKRKTSFALDDIDVDLIKARKWHESVIGTPYPKISGDSKENKNAMPSRAPSKRDAGIWERIGRRIAGENSRQLEASKDNYKPQELDEIKPHNATNETEVENESRRKTQIASPKLPQALRPSEREHSPAAKLVMPPANGSGGPEERTEELGIYVTVILKHSLSKLQRVNKVVVPSAENSDDRDLAVSIRQCHDSIRGRWVALLSARQIASVSVLRRSESVMSCSDHGSANAGTRTNGASNNRNGYSSTCRSVQRHTEESYITKLVLHPNSGRYQTRLISWARDYKTDYNIAAAEELVESNSRSDVPLCEEEASIGRVLEIRHTWAVVRILCALLILFVLAILSVLLWILLGPRGHASYAPADFDNPSPPESTRPVPEFSSGASASLDLIPQASFTLTGPGETPGGITIPAETLIPTEIPAIGTFGPTEQSPNDVTELASALFTVLASASDLPVVTPNLASDGGPGLSGRTNDRNLSNRRRGHWDSTRNNIGHEKKLSLGRTPEHKGGDWERLTYVSLQAETVPTTGSRQLSISKTSNQLHDPKPSENGDGDSIMTIPGIEKRLAIGNMTGGKTYGEQLDRVFSGLALAILIIFVGLFVIAAWLGLSFIAG